jgi:peptidylprolyl isomerase
VASLAASLTACTASSSAVACDATPSGSVSDAVKVSTDFGKKPTVTIKYPTAAPATQRTVVVKGTGATAVTGETVDVDFTLYDGATGAELTGTQYTQGSATAFPIDESQFLVGMVKTMNCSQVGSRVVGVIPAADSFGEAGSTQLGVKPGEDLVFVVDIVAIAPPVIPPLPKASGTPVAPTDGFPTVALAADGTPTVTIPDTAPPTDLKIAVLQKGSGAVVKDGANVVVHYVGVNWNTKKVFDSSWGRGAPATFGTGQVIQGFSAAIVGQTVGSQVIVIIPPAQGYGEAGSPPDIGPTDTLVFVVDILGIAA